MRRIVSILLILAICLNLAPVSLADYSPIVGVSTTDAVTGLYGTWYASSDDGSLSKSGYELWLILNKDGTATALHRYNGHEKEYKGRFRIGIPYVIGFDGTIGFDGIDVYEHDWDGEFSDSSRVYTTYGWFVKEMDYDYKLDEDKLSIELRSITSLGSFLTYTLALTRISGSTFTDNAQTSGPAASTAPSATPIPTQPLTESAAKPQPTPEKLDAETYKAAKEELDRIIDDVILPFIDDLFKKPEKDLTEGDYVYRVADGSAEIVKYVGKDAYISIPEALGGYPVSSIDILAFFENLTLREVEIPACVTSIGKHAFFGCTKMHYIRLPDGLTELDLSILTGCKGLVYLDMPANTRSITGEFPNNCLTAWTAANKVNSNYCVGKVKTEYGSYWKQDFSDIINLELIFRPAESQRADELYRRFVYKDSYFAEAAGAYNHELARISLGASMSSMRSLGGYFNDYNVIRALLDMGFRRIRIDEYPGPNKDTIGSAIASKTVIHNGIPRTLVAVFVCGGGYGKEWLSNFNINESSVEVRYRENFGGRAPSPVYEYLGDRIHHEGFKKAANTVMDRYKDYMNTLGLRKTEGLLWTTGYSRGAAISNMLAADAINDGLPPAQCYAYSFATPNNTSYGRRNVEKYSGIFSIVNPSDIVPRIPLSSWDFGRFGTVYYLPSSGNTDGNAYIKQFNRMLDLCKSIYYTDGGSAYPDLKFNALYNEGDKYVGVITQFIEKYAETLMPDISTYQMLYYDDICRIVKNSNMLNTLSGGFDIFLKVIISNTLLLFYGESTDYSLVNTLYTILGSGAMSKDVDVFKRNEISYQAQEYLKAKQKAEGSSMFSVILDLPNTVVTLFEVYIPMLWNGVGYVLSMHYPEQYLGWMMTLDESDLTTNEGTFTYKVFDNADDGGGGSSGGRF